MLARLLRPSRLVALDIEPAFLAEARARLDAEGVADGAPRTWPGIRSVPLGLVAQRAPLSP